MTTEQPLNLTVCGSGAMGSQIALIGALAGHNVTLYDIDEARLGDAVAELHGHMRRRVEKGRNSALESDAAFSRLCTTNSLTTAAHNAEFMIEAIVEKLDAKLDLFEQFSALAPANAVLATNSSSIVSSHLAGVTQDPSRVCNMHFFNPPLVMELVEVVQGEHTSNDTVARAMTLAVDMKKHPVHIHKEVFGFVVNRILTAIFDEAISLHEQGIASFADIDVAVRKGLGHPIGPFELLDLTGIDVNYHIKKLQAADTGNASDGPSRSITELYDAGKLGRKSGHGFYDYEAAN